MDALRIYAMFLIVLWHFMVHGEIRIGEVSLSSRVVLSVLSSITVIGVNLYVLLTGYFQSGKNFRFNKLLRLWTTVLFYSVSICLLFLVFGFPVGGKQLLASWLPILTKQYWFVTVYFVLYLLSPYLNQLLRHLDNREVLYLLAILLLFNSILPTLLSKDMALNPVEGQSILWFITLYLSGAFLRRTNCCEGERREKSEVKKTKEVLLYFASIVVLCLSRFVSSLLLQKLHLVSGLPDKLLAYNSPLVYFSAIACFIMFAKMKIQSAMTARIATLTFGIYLIHDNPYLRGVLYRVFRVSAWGDAGTSCLIAALLVGSMSVFCLCAALEYLRQRGGSAFMSLFSRDHTQHNIQE